VLRKNISSKNPPQGKAAKRWQAFKDNNLTLRSKEFYGYNLWNLWRFYIAWTKYAYVVFKKINLVFE
jgi:hypothetical protein